MNEKNFRPLVSVMVAARNEAENIVACLKSLELQDYVGEWEVLVADDHSEDQTLWLAQTFAFGKGRFRIFQVPEPESEVKGKALALGFLARQARGDLFLFCDADMQMPPGWMTGLVEEMQNGNTDMVNGTTCTAGETLFSTLQAVDWLVPQAHFSWMSALGIAFTAMGNNMAISRKAYEATGGYLHIPFSLTEDFELFRQARQKGFGLRHVFNRRVLGISTPQKTVYEWVVQHIRWMVGFFQLPFAQQWVFYLQLIFYPLWLLGFCFSVWPIFLILTGCWALKILSTSYFFIRLGKIHWLGALLLYEIIWWPAYMACLFGYAFSENIEWKGRKWKK